MTLEDAIVALVDDYSIGDMIYNVRKNTDMRGFDGNSWDHPRVVAFGQAVTALQNEAKRIKKERNGC